MKKITMSSYKIIQELSIGISMFDLSPFQRSKSSHAHLDLFRFVIIAELTNQYPVNAADCVFSGKRLRSKADKNTPKNERKTW